MTRLEWFENGYGQIGLALGIISASMFSKFIQYKVYRQYRDHGRKHMDAIENAADDCKCSPGTVWNSVQFFMKSAG